MTAAVLIDRFGPYHAARLSAAGARGAVVGVEFTARTREYAWDAVPHGGGFRRVTLADDAERLPAAGRGARLLAALDECKPGVVFANGWADRTLPALARWCARRRVPVVVMSESSALDGPRRAWKEYVKRRVVRGFAAALVGGRRHADYAAELGLPREAVFTGYDAVDNAHFAAGADAARADADGARARLGLPGRYFLASSRFVPKKNLPGLLRAYATYAEAHPDPWHLVLLGDGPGQGELEALRGELGLGRRVHLPGFKQYGELPAYYGLAGAFVHASTSEQWGLVVNEAMAAGLPAVVSERCGCAPDLVVAGVTGFPFDPFNTRALSDLLGRVAGDDAGRAAMGAAARARVESVSPEAFADGFWAAAEYARSRPLPKPGLAGRLALAALARGRV